MIPDPNSLTQLLGALEETITSNGWDQPPRLLVIGGSPTDLQAALLPVPVGTIAHPRLELAMAGVNWCWGHDEQANVLPRELAEDDIGALVLHIEAWGRSETPEGRAALPNRPLADIPGSVELRNLFAVDTTGRWFWTGRTRGQPASIRRFAPDGTPEVTDDVCWMRSRMAAAQTLMMLGIARFMKPDQHALPALPDRPAELTEALDLDFITSFIDTLLNRVYPADAE